MDPQAAEGVVGLVAETGCRYYSSVAYPDLLQLGLAVMHIGRTSVRYQVGVFRADAGSAAAVGHFVHVYVDAASRRPTPLPDRLRMGLAPLLVQDRDSPAPPPSRL